MLPNEYPEPDAVGRLRTVVAGFEQRYSRWPTALKLGRVEREQMRDFLGPSAYSRLLDRLTTLPDDEALEWQGVLVTDKQGHALEYGDVRAGVDLNKARLWLGIDVDGTAGLAGEEPEHTRLEWDILTDAAPLDAEVRQAREALANGARAGEWARVLARLRETPAWVNASRPGGSSGYTPLHQAAHLGAPAEIVRELLAVGAWRLLRSRAGELPVELASRRGHGQLVELLTPRPIAPVEPEDLRSMEVFFHAAIYARAADLVREHRLRLPQLEPLQELPMRGVWMPVPGMYGGFHYWLARGAPDPVLFTESWSRVVGGSGQKHEVTRYGLRLIAEGFA
jgi:hypothetical protein